MKKLVLLATLLLASCLSGPALAEEPVALESFLRNFTYETRKDMKCSGKELLSLLAKNEAVLVDIRFPEEQQAWGPGFGLKIPLNELPARLKELPKDKIIVTACPHIDRSNIAMVYLRTPGLQGQVSGGRAGRAGRVAPGGYGPGLHGWASPAK